MKALKLAGLIMAGLVVSGSATMLKAQSNASPACPFGYEPGYGRTLTAEQRAEHRAALQQTIASLREKQASNTISAEELNWLQQFGNRGQGQGMGARRGQRGGWGRGGGNGMGNGNGMGYGWRRGWTDASGPRCGNPNAQPANPAPQQ